MNSVNKTMLWTWAIKNIVAIICWVVLAIVFNKWWVALFGALFISDLKYQKPNTYRVCDSCGKHSPYARNPHEALSMAKAAGWVHYEDGDKDYCPECQNKF